LLHGRAVVVDTARRVGRRRRALNAGGIQQAQRGLGAKRYLTRESWMTRCLTL